LSPTAKIAGRILLIDTSNSTFSAKDCLLVVRKFKFNAELIYLKNQEKYKGTYGKT